MGQGLISPSAYRLRDRPSLLAAPLPPERSSCLGQMSAHLQPGSGNFDRYPRRFIVGFPEWMSPNV